MKAPRPAILVAALAALVLVGCPSARCPSRPFDDAAELLGAYRDMRRPARVIRAEARVERRDADGRIRGTVLMFIQRPDRVRFDAMTQFGPAAVLTSDGEEFALMDLRENRFLTGPPCPENIERLLGLRFSGPEVTRLVLGETPRIEAEQESLLCLGGEYLVTRTAADGRRQEMSLRVREADLDAAPSAQRLRLVRSEVFGPGGETEWRVTYGDHRFLEDPLDATSPRRGVVLPYDVRFEEPDRGIDTSIRFTQIDLNATVPEGAFTQRPRRGLSAQRVDCGG